MLVARNTRATVAGNHVKVTPRWVRPGILDIGRQRDGAAFAQLGAINVNLEDFQERSDARVIHRFRITHSHCPTCPKHKDQISITASIVKRAGAKAAASATSCARSQKAGMMVRA